LFDTGICGISANPQQSSNHSLKEVIRLDKSEQAYRNAAIAVAAGTASELQKQLNSDMAKVAGQMGRDARDAEKQAGQK